MNIENKKVLITGGTGFLGANLVHTLVNERNIPPKNIRIFYLENTSTKALEDLPKMDMFPGNILDKQGLQYSWKYLIRTPSEKNSVVSECRGDSKYGRGFERFHFY